MDTTRICCERHRPRHDAKVWTKVGTANRKKIVMVSKAGRELVSQVRRYNIQQFIQGSRGFTHLCLKIAFLVEFRVLRKQSQLTHSLKGVLTGDNTHLQASTEI